MDMQYHYRYHRHSLFFDRSRNRIARSMEAFANKTILYCSIAARIIAQLPIIEGANKKPLPFTNKQK